MSVAYKLHSTNVQLFTYGDYVNFPDDGKRWELIDGVAYMMAAPNGNHQGILMSLGSLFHVHLRGKKCRVYPAPYDVRIPLFRGQPDSTITTVVQPDLVIYCNPNNYDKKGGRAAPELAVEILSPASGRMDKHRKFMLYERAGVKEYWLVDPDSEMVEIYRLTDGKFREVGRYADDDKLPAPEIGCEDLHGLEIKAAEIFESMIRPEETEEAAPAATETEE